MANSIIGNPSARIELEGVTTYGLVDLIRPLTWSALPDKVRRRAKHSLMDTIGVSALGTKAEPVHKLKRVILPTAGVGHCTVFGPVQVRTGPMEAALINSLASHTLDFDDSGSGGHVSGIIVPTALAVAEEVDASGEQMLAAMVAGYETSSRLSKLLTMSHYYLGFHPSATTGTFGSVATAAHLLGLDRDQWANVFGIAGSLAAGSIGNFGSMVKGLHSGNASRAGIYAALLAREGFTGSTNILEKEAGFVRSHTMESDAAGFLRPLGEYGLENMFYKFNAACAGTHSGADGVRRLMAENEVTAEEIDRIVLRVPQVQTEIANIERPTTVEAGKFSIKFMAAAGALGINTAEGFPDDDAEVAAPAVHEMIERIEVVGMASVRHGCSADIAMHLRNGKVLELSLDSTAPFEDLDEEWAAVSAKFIRTAGLAFGAEAAERAASKFERFETVPSVRRFAAEIVGPTA